MTLKLETTEDTGKSQMTPESQLGEGEFVTPGRALRRGQVCLLGLVKAHGDLFLKELGCGETGGDPPRHGRTRDEEQTCHRKA